MSEQSPAEHFSVKEVDNGGLMITHNTTELTIFPDFDGQKQWHYSIQDTQLDNIAISNPFNSRAEAIEALLSSKPQFYKYKPHLENYLLSNT